MPGGKSRFASIESQGKNNNMKQKTVNSLGSVPSLVATNKK